MLAGVDLLLLAGLAACLARTAGLRRGTLTICDLRVRPAKVTSRRVWGGDVVMVIGLGDAPLFYELAAAPDLLAELLRGRADGTA